MSPKFKPHKHAPWSKKVLIPLWVIQLGLSLYQFAWSLTLLIVVSTGESDYISSNSAYAAWALNMALGFFLSIYIIFIIVKFAKFKLTTVQFYTQSIVAVIMGLFGLALYLAGRDFINSIMVAAEMLSSIGISIYVIVIRRRVRRGVLGEMKRPGAAEVELEGGRQAGPRVERRRSKDLTAVGSAQPVRRPSLESARTTGEVGGPEREPREFLR